MRSFAGSIADGEPFKLLPAHQIRKVRGHQKSTESKWKKGDVGMAKRFSIKYGNKG